MKTNAKAVALSVAIATSGLAGATLASAEQPAGKMEVQAAAKPADVKPDPAAARKALLAELGRLTPEQRKQLGEQRVQRAQQLTGEQIVAGKCFSHGVFCKGTSGFTKGVLCCVIMKANT